MKFIFILLIIPLTAYAGDFQHRTFLPGLAIAGTIDMSLRNMFWISNLEVTSKNNNTFLNSSGAAVVIANRTVIGGYDSYNSSDVSEFYKKNNTRINFVSNFILDQSNTIYSIGFDSGSFADKIKINKSFFIGFAHANQLDRKSYLVISAGSWIGGGVKETPCYDFYDRQYWCQNLTSWADYKPVYPKNIQYADLKYIKLF